MPVLDGLAGLGQPVIVENRPGGVIPGTIVAKARPGQLNCASNSTGSPAHLAAELFKFMAGVDIVRIFYKGAAPALIDVMSDQVHLTFGTATSSTPHIKTGKLRALAITSAYGWAK